MNNLTLKNKILAWIAIALCATMLASVVYLCASLIIEFTPEKEIVDTTVYDFRFVGKINLYEVDYEIVMKGKDNAFTVDAGKINGVTSGTYTHTEGQGWTFTFNDSNSTVVRSQYDVTTKMFAFIYHLNMGSRGEGNLVLSYEDTAFVQVGEKWQDIPSFSGIAAWFGGYVTTNVTISCDADGNFDVFDSQNYINPITGTYVFENGHYKFTTSDGVEYVTELNADNLQTFTIAVYNPQLVVYGMADATADMTQVILTVE